MSIMVDVAQLVESRIVIPVVVGSSPIVHPKFGPLAQLVEQETLNLLVRGSNPRGPTNYEMGLFFCEAVVAQIKPATSGLFWYDSSRICESGGIGRRAGFRYQCL